KTGSQAFVRPGPIERVGHESAVQATGNKRASRQRECIRTCPTSSLGFRRRRHSFPPPGSAGPHIVQAAGLRLPIGTNLPSLTLMMVTSLSGARDLFEKSAFPVTPAKLVMVKMASLIAFELRSVALFIAATIKLTES